MPEWATVRWDDDTIDTERLIEIIRALDVLGFVNMRFSAETEEGNTWRIWFDVGGEVVADDH